VALDSFRRSATSEVLRRSQLQYWEYRVYQLAPERVQTLAGKLDVVALYGFQGSGVPVAVRRV